MKRIAKISVLVCALVMALAVMFALAACNEAGTKYTYSSTSVESVGGTFGSTESMETMYDALYKDSTITVNDSKIVWTISDNETVMTVTKDGEKYILSGEYYNQLKTALSASLGSASVEISYEMYGLETEEGFDIIISVSANSNGFMVIISFVK